MAGPVDAPAPLPLFVYGLLRPGLAGFQELGLADRMTVIGPDRITGTLYDLGDYPGVVPGGTAVVHGLLLQPQDADVLALIDAYEEYDAGDPDGSEYLRVVLRTLHGVEAWVYAYNRPTLDWPIVPGGDWLHRRD